MASHNVHSTSAEDTGAEPVIQPVGVIHIVIAVLGGLLLAGLIIAIGRTLSIAGFNLSPSFVGVSAGYLYLLWDQGRYIQRMIRTGISRPRYGPRVRRAKNPARFRIHLIANIFMLAVFGLIGIAAAVEYLEW